MRRPRVSKSATLRERLDYYSAPFVSGQCREWLGAKSTKGYGRLMWKGRARFAHRLAYTEYIGPIPDGLHVLHSCDNPSCVNDEHFFLGTNADNVADKVTKGRAAKPEIRGERHRCAKLTEAQVLAIRADARTQAVIAAEYGVTRENISQIKLLKGWAWL